MTQGVDLRSLLERVQKAQGPDTELDVDLWLLADPKPVIQIGDRAYRHAGLTQSGDVRVENCPRYTASIDAAVGLVSKLLPGWQWNVEGGGMRQHACLYAPPVSKDDAWIGQRGRIAATPALSLLECLLAALIAKAEAEEGVGEF